MCLILALLRVLLSHSNEDAMLSRLEEMDLHIGSLFAQLHCATISVEGMAGTGGYLSADTTLAWSGLIAICDFYAVAVSDFIFF